MLVETALLPRKLQQRVFVVTWIAYAGFYLCRKNLSVLIPVLQSERGIGKLELANIVFGYSLCYAAGQFIAGPLSDRFGPRAVVGTGLAVAALANLGMGFTGVYGWLFALSLVNGAAQSCGWPGLVKNMAAWFQPARRGIVMGWWTTNYVAGGFLATLFASWAIGSTGLWPGTAWQRGFVLPALVLLAIAAGFVLAARNRPSDEGFADLPDERAAKAEAPGAWLGAFVLLKQRAVWITAITALALKVIRYSFLFWLPLYLTEQTGSGATEAGYSSSVYELAGSGGALLAGYLSDRVFGSRRFPVATLMLAGLACACALHPLFAAQGRIWNLIGIALIGIMTYGPDTLMQGPASQDIGTQRSAASAAGLVCGIASLGQLLSPYLVAGLVARFGWGSVFQFFIALALGAACLSAVNWNFRPLQVQSS